MRKSFIRIEIPEGKVKDILDRLERAQQEIRDCYCELEDLGVVTIRKEETARGN